MTTLAIGTSQRLYFSAGDVLNVSAGGGTASVNVAPAYGVSESFRAGPAAWSKRFGPFQFDTLVTITNTSASLTYVSSARKGMRLVVPAGLRRWRRVLDEAQFVPAEIHVIGSSSVFGQGADSVDPSYPSGATAAPTDAVGDSYSFVGQLRRMFTARFAGVGANAAGYIHCQQSAAVASGGGVNAYGLNNYGRFVSNAATLTYTVPACTAIDIDFYENGGANGGITTGAFTYDIDAAGAVSVPNAGGADVYRRISVTGLSNAAHTVVITGTGGANAAEQIGLRYHSGYGVAVARAGRPGWCLADALNVGPNQLLGVASPYRYTTSLKAFGMTSNTLNIVAFCTNDFLAQSTASRTDLASFRTQLTAVVRQNAANGGCTLLMSLPDKDTSVNASNTQPAGRVLLPAYWDVMADVAAVNDHTSHCRVTDVLGMWGEARAAGLALDASHMNRSGHGTWARALFNLLSDVPGEYGV